jgi:cytoskeleton protein RodZ
LDLRTLFRVIHRFWPLVALGVVLAVALSFISFFRVDLQGRPHVAYRQHETWRGTEVLLLTQRGFPWGRTVYPYVISKKTGLLIPAAPFADPGRFNSLAVFYAQLANSDAVRALVTRAGRLDGTYSASPVVKSVGGGPGTQPITQLVPLIQIDGFARTPAQALGIARRVSHAMRSYLERTQTNADIPVKQRIVVQVLSTARKATLARGRRLTIPIIAFLAILIATLGLAFVLENLRPREREGSEPAGEPSSDSGEPRASGAVGDDSRPPAPREADGHASAGLGYRPSSAATTRFNGAAPGRSRTPTLGRRLREARVRRGLDLPVVEARIEVPTKCLRALESERFDLLPGSMEGRRALRTYAELLELDPEPCLGEFDARVAALAGPAPQAVPSGRWKKAKTLSLPISMLVVTIAVSLLSLFWRGWLFKQAAASTVDLRAASSSAATPASPSAPLYRAQSAPEPGRRTATPAGPKLARFVVSAARGDSWLVVRAGSNHGKVLFAGVLKQGRSLRLQGARLWVRLGAATNLDVSVNGSRPDAELYGTLDALVTPSGFRKVPLTL